MILSQDRGTGWWTLLRTQRRTRYEPVGEARLLGRLLNVHDPSACASAPGCAIHDRPSDHPLKEAPLNWREDRGILERICHHGVGHPDRDSAAYLTSIGEDNQNIHGCDGCCVYPNPINPLFDQEKTPHDH